MNQVHIQLNVSLMLAGQLSSSDHKVINSLCNVKLKKLVVNKNLKIRMECHRIVFVACTEIAINILIQFSQNRT